MASSAASPPNEQQQPGCVVDAASLSLEQLVGIQRDLESEIQNLSLHLRTLLHAKSKLLESQEALQRFCCLDNSSGSAPEGEAQSESGVDLSAAAGEHGAGGKRGEGEDERGDGTREGGEGGTEKAEGKGKDGDAGKSAGAAEKEKHLEVLVPLTGSLYVKGRLTTREKLLVDIGTGFWVEKTGDEANKRLERTSEKVSEQMAKVEKIISEKQRQAEASRALIQQKYLQQQLALSSGSSSS